MAINSPLTKTVIGRVSYLNSTPFFHGWPSGDAWDWIDASPRQLGQEAQAGRLTAGPMALGDFLRLRDQFERMGNLGIAVRGRCGSVSLFSKRPIRQLDGATIGITDHTSTTALLLRLILEQRHQCHPKEYVPNVLDDTDAVLLIGDEALKFHAHDHRYPYETDLAFEWWLWQHLPAVFAVWVVRQDASVSDKQQLLRLLQRQLTVNLSQLSTLETEGAEALGVPADRVKGYLERFVYRLGELEETAITRFTDLVHEHRLL